MLELSRKGSNQDFIADSKSPVPTVQLLKPRGIFEISLESGF
jgi:hypothetical protein